MKSGASVASDAIKSGGQVASSAMHEGASAIKEAFSGLSGKTELALEKTLQACRDFLESIDEKLPQHALT